MRAASYYADTRGASTCIIGRLIIEFSEIEF